MRIAMVMLLALTLAFVSACNCVEDALKEVDNVYFHESTIIRLHSPDGGSTDYYVRDYYIDEEDGMTVYRCSDFGDGSTLEIKAPEGWAVVIDAPSVN